MKKLLLFLVLPVIFITGCSEENLEFSGESESWEGKYSSYIVESTENGEFTFDYKKAEKDMVIENLKIDVNDGETVLNKSEHKDSTITIPTGCSGCAVTNANEPIKVIIEWGDGKVETFSMDPK